MTIVQPDTIPVNDNLKGQFRSVCEILSRLDESSAKALEVDLSDAEWLTPAFLSPASVVFQRDDRLGGGDVHLPDSVEGYLSQINFPMGSDSPTEAHRNDLPLCRLNTQSGPTSVERVGSKMTELLNRALADSIESISAVRYPVNELVDNVDQHSRCANGALLIQNYPNKSFIDICVADDGIGIPGSYEENGEVVDSDEEALRKALDGESTKSSGGDRGYGIKTTTEMICDGLEGEILFASGDAAIHKRGSDPYETFETPTDWPGTVFVARPKRPDESFNYIQYVG